MVEELRKELRRIQLVELLELPGRVKCPLSAITSTMFLAAHRGETARSASRGTSHLLHHSMLANRDARCWCIRLRSLAIVNFHGDVMANHFPSTPQWAHGMAMHARMLGPCHRPESWKRAERDNENGEEWTGGL